MAKAYYHTKIMKLKKKMKTVEDPEDISGEPDDESLEVLRKRKGVIKLAKKKLTVVKASVYEVKAMALALSQRK